MALNIANKRVEEKAARLARLLDTNKTRAVETALDYYLAHQSEDKRQDRRRVMEDIRAVLARIDALPVLDDRSADEIVGYDENGLPK